MEIESNQKFQSAWFHDDAYNHQIHIWIHQLIFVVAKQLQSKAIAHLRRSKSWPTKYRQANGSTTHSSHHISSRQLSLGADVRSEKIELGSFSYGQLINPSRRTINNHITRVSSHSIRCRLKFAHTWDSHPPL